MCALFCCVLPAVGPDIFKFLFFKFRVVCIGSTGLKGYSVCIRSRIRTRPGVVNILGTMIHMCHSPCRSCTAVTSWAGLSISTFHSFNVTAAMRQDIATSVPSPHTTTCSLSKKSICSLAAVSRLARVIPQTTSLQRTSGCTLHKLNLGLHLHRDRQCGFNPWGTDQIFVTAIS